MRMRQKEINSATKSGATSAKDGAKDFFLRVQTNITYKEDTDRI
jgi:hypothetical protein